MTKEQLRAEIVDLMRRMERYIDNGGTFLDKAYEQLENERKRLRDELYETPANKKASKDSKS